VGVSPRGTQYARDRHAARLASYLCGRRPSQFKRCSYEAEYLPAPQNKVKELYGFCVRDGVEVLSLACDVEKGTVRIAAGMKNGVVARIDCDEHKISFKWGKEFEHVVPRMVGFCQPDATGVGGENILALGFWDGMAYVQQFD
jgi:hypothetical protein